MTLKLMISTKSNNKQREMNSNKIKKYSKELETFIQEMFHK